MYNITPQPGNNNTDSSYYVQLTYYIISSIKKEVALAVLKAFKLLEEMNGSHKNLIDILAFGRDLYCSGASVPNSSCTFKLWPTTWSACINILKEFGYTEPRTYHICLDGSHQNLWSAMDNPTDLCRYCQNPGTIQFHYLTLHDKVKRWCSSPSFCKRMAAHCLQKERWMNGTGSASHDHSLIEIWDGKRFAETSWFWDPNKRWLLPVRCGVCSQIVSAEEIATVMEGMTILTPEVMIVCPHCYHKFSHSPQYARGDPRNLALIGHWDGRQPFSSSNKHSCGKVCKYVCSYSYSKC